MRPAVGRFKCDMVSLDNRTNALFSYREGFGKDEKTICDFSGNGAYFSLESYCGEARSVFGGFISSYGVFSMDIIYKFYSHVCIIGTSLYTCPLCSPMGAAILWTALIFISRQLISSVGRREQVEGRYTAPIGGKHGEYCW